MVPESDIYRAARALIDRFGDDAGGHTVLRALQGLRGEGPGGESVRKRMLRAVLELLNNERPADAPLH